MRHHTRHRRRSPSSCVCAGTQPTQQDVLTDPHNRLLVENICLLADIKASQANAKNKLQIFDSRWPHAFLHGKRTRRPTSEGNVFALCPHIPLCVCVCWHSNSSPNNNTPQQHKYAQCVATRLFWLASFAACAGKYCVYVCVCVSSPFSVCVFVLRENRAIYAMDARTRTTHTNAQTQARAHTHTHTQARTHANTKKSSAHKMYPVLSRRMNVELSFLCLTCLRM